MNIGTPRILIANAHSQANAGDQAIVLGQIRLLNQAFPGARLTITSRTAGLDRPLWAARGVTVIPPIFNAPSGARGRWRAWGQTLLSLLFPWQALVFLRRLLQADLVLACGGGYFYSTGRIPGFTFWQNYLPLRLAAWFRKEIVFFPQSFGPLANLLSRRLISGLLASAYVRAVLAREEISLSILAALLPATVPKSKIRFCPDMAFYYSPEPLAPVAEISDLPRPRLALALRDWDFPAQKTRSAKMRKREEYIEGVLAVCRRLHRRSGASFFIFSQAQGPSDAEDDRRISAHVYERLGPSIPPSHLRCFPTPLGTSPATLIRRLRHADMIVTSRMHAAIFAFLAGIPAVVIGYQHKSGGILDSLGLGPCALPIDEISEEALLSRCVSILDDREKWRAIIVPAVNAAREAIMAEFRGLLRETGWGSAENIR